VRKCTLILVFFIVLFCEAYAQKAIIEGIVLDINSSQPIELVTVFIESTQIATETNVEGIFRLEIPANEEITLVFRRIGYQETTQKVAATPEGITRKLSIALLDEKMDVDIVVRDSRMRDLGMIREETAEIKLLPSVTGNLESALPSLTLGTNAGSGGELTSQYSVRGGNYDENLIYVNDFEIFRPQLIRSGQQEGLTFPNLDLIKDLSFSSGGFESKYGDKLSSVLDIKYKRPTEQKSSFGLSALGASVHTEGSTTINGRKLRYLLGGRYKTNKYLLSSLEVVGEYQPNHGDIQAYLTYELSDSWQVDLLSNYNISQYNFVPESGKRAVGLIDFTVNLFTVYEGAEQDEFQNAMAGISATYLPERKKNPYFLKFLASAYNSLETESFDIIGFYRLSQIETSIGAENAGEEIALLGTGTQHNFARNKLNSNIVNFQHKGGYELQLTENGSKSHFLQWSVKLQNESINDNLKEWERLDSAGYSVPFSISNVYLQEYLRTKNEVNSNRLTSSFQDSYTIQNDEKEIRFTAGVRASYWTYNKDFFVTPRFQLLYKPLTWKRDISFKLATGLYYQPAFYRELRRLDGTLNNELVAQKSAHIVGGITYDFKWKKVSEKPFKFITEVYYKKLWDMVSYNLDNVKIKYSGENDSDGYVIGLDTRINGEFVPGAESWVNISLLQARERIDGVEHLTFGANGNEVTTFVPRPTDQALFLNLFFQDYLPKNENFKAHFLLAFGSGIAYGIEGNNTILRNTFRYPSYRRIDVGFSYQLWQSDWIKKKPNHFLRWTENSWISLEVFNLLGISNVASTTWIKSIYNVSYGIPNRLTSRRVNLRLKVDI